MPKQEKIKSALLTNSAEFRVGVVQTLNTLGFTAEKLSVEGLSSLGPLLSSDPLVWNVVVDAVSLFPGETELEGRFREIEAAIGKAAVTTLVYVPSQLFEALASTFKAFPKLRFRPLPARRQDVVDHFVKPFNARHGRGKDDKAPAKPSASQAGDSIAEAIQHAKQTIDLLQKVSADRSAVAAFVAIGQRFNGLYGAYLFLGGKDGYHQLRMICEIIDALGKTYGKGEGKSALAPAHVELMMRCAKCVFAILKEMRSGKSVAGALNAETEAIRKAYDTLEDVFRREAESQEFVDEILRKYSA